MPSLASLFLGHGYFNDEKSFAPLQATSKTGTDTSGTEAPRSYYSNPGVFKASALQIDEESEVYPLIIE